MAKFSRRPCRRFGLFLLAVLCAAGGCAQWGRPGGEWDEVWHGAQNLASPEQGAVSPRAAKIDRNFQRSR